MDAWICVCQCLCGFGGRARGEATARGEAIARDACEMRTIFVIWTSCSDMPAVGFMLAIMPLGLFGNAIVCCVARGEETAAEGGWVARE
jgi:hypothetical protein